MKTKQPAAASKTRVTFTLAAETKGALRFQEIDDQGAPVEMERAFVGTLYFRKSQFASVSADWASEGKPPQRLTITVDCA